MLAKQLSLLQSTSLAIHIRTPSPSHAYGSQNAQPAEKPFTPSPKWFSSSLETLGNVPSSQFGHRVARCVPGIPGHHAHLGRERAGIQERKKNNSHLVKGELESNSQWSLTQHPDYILPDRGQVLLPSLGLSLLFCMMRGLDYASGSCLSMPWRAC